MVLYRVWLNGLWFGSHNKILNFHNWTPCYNELFYNNRRKWKSMDLSMDLWHSNNMKVILPNFATDHCFWTLWTLYVDCFHFSCVYSISFLETWLNLQLCGRSHIKSVLFICPSICMICDAFSSVSTLIKKLTHINQCLTNQENRC